MKSNCKCTIRAVCLCETNTVEMKKLIDEAYDFIYRAVLEFPGQREWRGDWLKRADVYRKK